MKKSYFHAIGTFLLLSCSQSRVKESDLIGKTFRVKYHLDQVKAETEAQKQLLTSIASLNYSYSFQSEGKGTYTALGMQVPMQWGLIGDSIKIDLSLPDMEQSNQYHIEPSEGGYLMKSDSLTVSLSASE
ncbi:hypothetical protein DYU11_18370 [Fibrisoma montanum]|uniref:Uncharacterized protein n=1 Tax=Fibrisoma montanum TaxID=2305895 RepID=A0A418M681_9BACT|nr:hypothetical protein [Fibrisoma montanum]RIV21372.1 hypothetical protein DYU11_18370 [Fibrisoma montanum]